MSQHPTPPSASQATVGGDGNPANITTRQFVQFVHNSSSPNQGPKGPSRPYHKKSRNGCRRCRTRRVKCDEIHPTCRNCRRHKEACLYNDADDGAKPQSETQKQNPASNIGLDVSDTSPSITSPTDTNVPPELSESRSRRLLELELLHHYNTRTSQTLLVNDNPTAADAWVLIAPSLALGNDALLYSIFSLSAYHMAETGPHRRRADTLATHRRYLDLALRRHSADITRLNAQSFDAVCIASSILRTIAFAMLRDRPLDPYTPPVPWLQMTRGTLDVFEASWPWMGDGDGHDPDSIAARLTKRMPVLFDDEAKFGAANRRDLLHLLRRDEADVADERWQPEDQDAYETTTSYIGGVWIAMMETRMEGPDQQRRSSTSSVAAAAEICRRLILFPFVVQSRFIDLVREGQPRALAVLAHYFALLARFRGVWWIGDTGRREVRALSTVLASRGKWHELMMGWPLRVMEEEPLSP